MRHNVDKHTFGRKQGPRIALLRNLVSSLVEHGRIKTTLPKARELRRHVEKAITVGKAGSLHSRRVLLSRYPNSQVVKTIVDDLSVRFKSRPGGYTRIIKLGSRAGDKAEMAYIQFVDYQVDASAKSSVASDKREKQVAVSKSLKIAVKEQAKQKKRIRKLQKSARRISR